MLKAIIFDMDGVLVESEGAISQSFNLVLEKYGVNLTNINKKEYLGRSLRDQMEVWKKMFPQIPKDLEVEKFSKEALKYQLEISSEQLKPNESILNLIKSAKEQGIKIAVATSSMKYRAETFLELMGILDKLDTLVTADDVIKHKPNPAVFLEAAKRLQVEPKNCVVIEDAVNGIEAAKGAGMKAVAKLTQHHAREDFFEADYIFSDFKDLKINDLINLF